MENTLVQVFKCFACKWKLYKTRTYICICLKILFLIHIIVYVFNPQLCLILCDLMDCNLVGSSAHGILQARIPGWVVTSFCRGSSWPRGWTCISCVSCIGGWVVYHCTTTVEPPNNCLVIIELDGRANY